MRDIELVIFDCDGVLIDSEVISATTLIHALDGVGVAVDFSYVQKHFLGRSWAKVADEIRKAYGFSPDDDFEEAYRRELLERFETELVVTQGVEAVIDGLNCKVCVATSSTPRRVKRSLEIVGLADRFGSNVFTASEVKNGKPAPDLFLHAAAKMGVVPENCLVIEDSAPGVEAAQNAGMRVLRYSGGSHLSGIPLQGLSLNGRVTCFDNWRDFRDVFDRAERQLAIGGRDEPKQQDRERNQEA